VSGLEVRLAGDRGEGRPVVADVGFAVPEGGAVALVGRSGSGKSLTGLALARLLPEGLRLAAGRVLWREQDGGRTDLAALPERALRRHRGRSLAYVFQDPATALDPVWRIGSQLREVLALHRPELDRAARRAEAVRLLGLVELPDPETLIGRYPHQLSGGQRQRVMLALALAGRPRLLVADEPTSALDPPLRRQVLDLLDRLRAELGLAVLWISHDLAEVAHRCDHMVVLDRGRVVEAGPPQRLLTAPEHAATRELAAAARPSGARPSATDGGGALLRVSQLRVRAPSRAWRGDAGPVLLDGITFDLARGETLAVVGESGSGKTTLLRALLALPGPHPEGAVFLDLPEVGRVDWLGLPERRRRPLRRHLGPVFQDPHGSLDPRLALWRSVAEPLEVHRLASRSALRERAVELLVRVGLEPELADRLPGEVSGGQAQRVAIARALAPRPALMLCDEAVSALDVVAQRHVLELLRRLQDEDGFGLLFVAHDLGVVRALAHRTLVLDRGRMVRLGPTEEVFADPRAEAARRLVAADAGLDSAP